MVLIVDVTLKMLRKKSKAVLDGNGSISQDACIMLGGVTREELRRVIMSETIAKALEEFKDDMRGVNQRLASLEQDARQPRFATKADVTADKKTRERIEGPAAAVQAKHEDSCSAKKIQADSMSSTSFGKRAAPPALPRRDDVLVDIGAAVSKPCLSPVEMGTQTAAGGLLPTGKISTATMVIFQQLPLGFCLTKEIKSRTSNQYVMDYNSFWKLKVLKTKLGQTLVFDPVSCTGHLRAYPLLGAWRALLGREVLRLGAGWYLRPQHFLADG